jgi:uncharacterized protein
LTSRSPGDDALTWNVTGLLADPPGSERVYPIDDVRIDLGDLQLAEPVAGRVRLQRTNRGILATADLRVALALACSRCLRDIEYPVEVQVVEEFLPSVDLSTGQPVPSGDEPEALRLTDHHEVELGTPVREAIQLAEPIAPLCRPDCQGLCIVCGGRLDEGTHDHPDDDVDPRLEALRAFRPSDD